MKVLIAAACICVIGATGFYLYSNLPRSKAAQVGITKFQQSLIDQARADYLADCKKAGKKCD
jgi:hypothetical protein